MASAPIDTLLRLMADLRDPVRGCPWDVAQTFASIVPYTIQESYEVADAVERGDVDDIRDELGDLLLQVVFQAQIAREAGLFDFDAVATGISRKLIRRHPHVFDPQGALLQERGPTDQAAVNKMWERIKAEERAEKAARSASPPSGPLDGVPHALPALSRAEKISRKAASFGFDWPDAVSVIAKVREEVDEVEQGLAEGETEAIREEIGDLLFSVANLARHAGIDPEEALRRGTNKFERRFTAMASRLAEAGSSLATADLAAMEAGWQEVKADERKAEEPRPQPASA